jgi:fructokinase
VFGVIVGTGNGGRHRVDGRVLVGPNAVAGEWGHNPLPWPRDGEWPGRVLLRQDELHRDVPVGPGLALDHERATGESVDAPELARRAAAGDAAAEATLARYEDRMARALAGVINILDPDVIVLGGGMSNLTRLYESVPRLWTEYAFSDRVDTPLRAAVHGDSSGVRGAAWLWPETESP